MSTNQEAGSTMVIIHDERSTPTFLICALWTSERSVPPELTFGDHQLPTTHVS